MGARCFKVLCDHDKVRSGELQEAHVRCDYLIKGWWSGSMCEQRALKAISSLTSMNDELTRGSGAPTSGLEANTTTI